MGYIAPLMPRFLIQNKTSCPALSRRMKATERRPHKKIVNPDYTASIAVVLEAIHLTSDFESCQRVKTASLGEELQGW
jgi:hypothetical protein